MPYWPLNEKLNTTVDKIGATITKAVNCRRDDRMGWLKFPGAALISNLGAQVDGVYWWESAGYGVAVSGGRVLHLSEDGSYVEISGAELQTGTNVSFADFGDTLYMANGGRIVQWEKSDSTCQYISDVDAPTNVTHIGFINLFLMALDSNGVVWFSEVNEPGTWLGEFFKAEAMPDKTTALLIGWEEVVCFGTATVESFWNSGEADGPFSSIQGSTIERGIIAPNSVAKVDQTYFYLDEERKVVRLNGRSPVVISEAVRLDLQNLDTVEDARGFHLNCQGETYYCLIFPAAGKGFAYDYKRDDWTEIGGFSDGQYTAPAIQCGAYFKRWNKYIAGGRDGKLYEVSTANHADRMEINIRLNWGTDERKYSNYVRFKLKRGQSTSLSKLLLSYRDNGTATWKGEREISLGQTVNEETYFYVKVNRLGQYRDREWRLVVSDDVEVNIVSVEESVQGE